jgi:DNA-binding winged helix-turn-helix (wHTH) protein
VSQARRALGDDAQSARFIQTYHGRGYRFIALVMRDETKETSAPQASSHIVHAFTPAAVPADAESTPDYDQLIGREVELQMLAPNTRARWKARRVLC